MINISKQKKVFLTPVCIGLCDKGQVRSGGSVVWTINCWTLVQLAIFTVKYQGRQRQVIFISGTALHYIPSIRLLDFILMNNALAKR